MGQKNAEMFDGKALSAMYDKILLFKDLGPRLPFEIGGVWTGDLSLCD